MISIIVPAYNQSKFIDDALRSILSQSFQNYEVVIVDDGSTDPTGNVVKRYLSDKRFRYYFQKNQGPSAARNFGLSTARGEYVVFLDADDIFLPEKLMKQRQYLHDDPSCDLVFSDSEYFYNDLRNKTFSVRLIHDRKPEDAIYIGNIFPISSAMVRTKSLSDHVFDQALTYQEDWDFWLRYVVKGHRMCFQTDILTRIRIHGNNRSKGYDLLRAWDIKVCDKVLKDYSNSISRKNKQNLILSRTNSLVHLGQFEEARRSFREAVRTYPLGMIRNKRIFKVFFKRLLLGSSWGRSLYRKCGFGVNIYGSR